MLGVKKEKKSIDIVDQTKSVNFSKNTLMGICDIHLLGEGANMKEKMKLLSFICQIDCRQLPEKEIETISEFFRSLKPTPDIAHPTDFFRIRKA